MPSFLKGLKNKLSALYCNLHLAFAGSPLFNKVTIAGIPFGFYLVGFAGFFTICIFVIAKSSFNQAKTLADILTYQQLMAQMQSGSLDSSSGSSFTSQMAKVKNKVIALSLANHITLQPSFNPLSVTPQDTHYLLSIKGPSYLRLSLQSNLAKNDLPKLQSILQQLPKDKFYQFNSLKIMDAILLQTASKNKDEALTRQIAKDILAVKHQTPAKISLIKNIVSS